MKSTLISCLKAMIMLNVLFYFSAIQAQDLPFEFGLGTSQFPYNISTPTHLASLARLVNEGNTEYNNKCYRLENNISLSSYGSNFNNGAGWIPIGTDENPFLGSFDGNNKTITNLYINDPLAETCNGFFGRIHGGKVKNLNISGNVTGAGNTGGIAGYITYNSSAGTVGEISNSLFQGMVIGNGENVGGVAGRILNGRLVNCYATGTVTGENNTGGIAGSTYGGSITNCAALNQSVKANGAGANVARVACSQSGIGASTLSGNFAFYEMIVTSNNTAKTISNNAGGPDGASKTALELQTANGYPNGFNASPWVFTPGRLPGLGTTVVKPQYLAAIRLSLSVQRNGMAWNNHGKTFTLRMKSDETVTQVMSGTGSSLMAIVKQSGVWKVYEDNTDTGAIITANEVTGEGTVNYFTVSFSVVSSGAANGSAINAVYDGSAISSGATVLSGKQLDITATGAGATTYMYSWSGAGTSSQTTNSITIGFLDSRIDAQCVVTSTHAVTFSTVSGNGTLSATVDGVSIASGALVQYGKNVEFTATPNPNYRINEWKDNGNKVDETDPTYMAYYITKAYNVTVEFEYITHEVTFNTVNSFGTLAATVDGTGIKSGALIEQGEQIIFTATPATGYKVKQWFVNNVPIENYKLPEYTVESLMEPVLVRVEFDVATYEIIFNKTGNGAIAAKVGDNNINSGDMVEHGREVVLTAEPVTGYRVKEWLVNEKIENGNNLTYTITSIISDHEITVIFEPIPYQITFNVVGNNGGLIAAVQGKEITTGEKVDFGERIIFTASPDYGFKMKAWTVNSNPATSDASDEKQLTLVVSGETTVTVDFVPVTYPVTFGVVNGNGGLTATVNGENILTGHQVNHGDGIVFTAEPAPDYRVKEWKLDDEGVSGNNTPGFELTNLTTAVKVMVEFEMITYTVSCDVVGGHGTVKATVDGNAVTGAIPYKNDVVFTATPETGYQVKEWRRNGAVQTGETDDVYTLKNLNDNETVTVQFELKKYTVSFSVEGGNGNLEAKIVGGSTVASGEMSLYGSSVEFTATPVNNGYKVEKWMVDGVTQPNETSVKYTLTNLTKAVVVKVFFTPVTYKVTFGTDITSVFVNDAKINSGDFVKHGDDVLFTTTPAANLRVSQWTLNNNPVPDNISNNYTLFNLDGDANVAVTFELITYGVTFNVVNGNGSIVAKLVDGAVITSVATVDYGRSVEFTATPAPGYRVKAWRHNNATVNGRNLNYSINNITAPHTVTVEFEVEIVTNITYSVTGGNGEISAKVDGESIASGNAVTQGKDVLFEAIPNTGYCVTGWLHNGVAVNETFSSYMITDISGSHDVKVSFGSGTYTATHSIKFWVVNGNGDISVTVGDSPETTTETSGATGSVVVFNAKPNKGYRVKEWKLNNEVIPDEKGSSYTLPSLSSAVEVTVEYELISYTVKFNSGTGGSISATVDGRSIISGDWVEHGKSVRFTISTNTGYQAQNWTNGGVPISGITGNSYTLVLESAADIVVTFALRTSAVTFNTVGNGTIKAEIVNGAEIFSPATVDYDKEVVFTANPANGYRIKRWTDNDKPVNGVSANYSINITTVHDIIVEFELITYPVTFDVIGGNGSLIAKTDKPVTSGEEIEKGSNIVFTATPATGYQVKEWRRNDRVPSNASGNSFTITNLSAVENVTVEFELEKYKVTFGDENGNGTVLATVNSSGISSGANVKRFSNIEFTASPATGYRVIQWKLDGVVQSNASGNSYTLENLTKAVHVTAVFDLLTYTLTHSVTGGNGELGVKIFVGDNEIVSGTSEILRGSNVIFTAKPNTGYRIKEWKRNGATVNGVNETYSINNIRQDYAVTVEFEPIPSKTYVVTFSVVNGNGALAASIGSATVSSGTAVPEGSNLVFTASPNTGFCVKEWTIDGVKQEEMTGTDYTIERLTAATEITVEFKLAPSYLVTFGVISGNGTISATVGSSGIASNTQVLQGSNIVFTAIPDDGYRVKEWKKDGVKVSGTGRTYTLPNLNEAANVTVEFEFASYEIVFAIIGEGGTLAVTVDGEEINSGISLAHGKRIDFKATPVPNYRIKEWKDNELTVNGDNMEYTIPNLTAAHKVTVAFEPIAYAVNFFVVNGNGTLEATVDDTKIESGLQVIKGKNIVFTAKPNEGYRVKEWISNGTIIAGNTTVYELENLSDAATVKVEYEPASYTVTFSVVNDDGAINAVVSGLRNIESGTLVEHGRSIEFTAIPNSDYHVVKEWKLNGKTIDGNITNKYSITLTDEAEVTVEFRLKMVTIEPFELLDGFVGIMFSQLLFATSSEQIKWSVIDGDLPDGLILLDNGEISGIPEKAGAFSFTVKAESASGNDTKELFCTIGKGEGKTVGIPVANNITNNSITINALTSSNGQTVEYAISTVNTADAEKLSWQTGLTFNNLTAKTNYYVYARSKENDDYFTGAVSVSEPITTTQTGNGELDYVTLKGFVQGGRLYVSGLCEGKQWNVYSISGLLVYRGIAIADEVNIPLSAQGVYIIQSEERTVKIAYYGQ